MKFVCLGYLDEAQWEAAGEAAREGFVDSCFAYDDELRRNGNWIGGEALEAGQNTMTVRWRNGGVAVTEGPFAETKEQIGGILLLEARDLNHAIALMSKHPGVRFGGFEIHAADEHFNALIEARNRASRQSKPA